MVEHKTKKKEKKKNNRLKEEHKTQHIPEANCSAAVIPCLVKKKVHCSRDNANLCSPFIRQKSLSSRAKRLTLLLFLQALGTRGSFIKNFAVREKEKKREKERKERKEKTMNVRSATCTKIFFDNL